MHPMILFFICLFGLGFAYKFYSPFVAKQAGIDPDSPTPSQRFNDGVDYVGCLNNNCSKLTNENMENKEKDLVKDNKSNINNVMMKNLDILVSLVYIFLLVILLLGSIIKRDASNLVNILIITLIYLFYQIYMSFKK